MGKCSIKISLGVSKGVMKFSAENYDRDYAPNTRETFRRLVLHQFVQARIADYNPDIPDLPVNSPRAHYGISKEALEVIKTFGTKNWKAKSKEFKESIGDLAKTYAKKKAVARVPVTLPKW